MSRKGLAMAALSWALLGWGAPTGWAQESEGYDAASLKKALADGGYEPKPLTTEIGKEKFEILIKRPTFNIPIGVEVSPSKRFVWFTVNLGPAPDPDKAPAARFADLLKANAESQPAFFYVTAKGNLMMAVPMENRLSQAAMLRFCVDKLADETVKQSSRWNVAAPTP